MGLYNQIKGKPTAVKPLTEKDGNIKIIVGEKNFENFLKIIRNYQNNFVSL